MSLFKKIVIAGAGFMGTSLMLDAKKTGTAEHICAFTHSKERAAEIKQNSVFDSATHLWHEALSNTDLVVLAAPVKIICTHLTEIESYLERHPDHDFPITDMGSVKQQISEQAKKLKRVKECFVGAHPLCGSEKSGMQHAFPDLYKNMHCIITSDKNHKYFNEIVCFWKNIGCRISLMTPEKHDLVLGYTSHFPHALSYLLADFVPGSMLRFSGSAFKDMTRIARSNPELWENIFEANKEHLLKIIPQFQRQLINFTKLIAQGNPDKLRRYLLRINKKIHKI